MQRTTGVPVEERGVPEIALDRCFRGPSRGGDTGRTGAGDQLSEKGTKTAFPKKRVLFFFFFARARVRVLFPSSCTDDQGGEPERIKRL